MAKIYRFEKYIILTEEVIYSPIEDADSKPAEFDEESLDRPLEIYLSISSIRNVEEAQFLVFKLMGYNFTEMQEVMPQKSLNKVYHLGDILKKDFRDSNKEIV